MLISEALLCDYYGRYGAPQVALLELSHSIVKPDNMGEMEIFGCYSTNINNLTSKLDPTYARFERVFHCLRFNTPTLWRLAGESMEGERSRLLHNRMPQERLQNDLHPTIEYPIFQENIEALTRICRFAKERGIDLRLFVAPLWKGYRKTIANYQQWIDGLRRASLGVCIYDYSELFEDHPEYFNDEMHLNATGAAVFSERLVQDGLFVGRSAAKH
jgi:hypothetical protein